MEHQTILILDSQLHRGGYLEQGLSSRGFNVFRASRNREAQKLLQALHPARLILAWEGEGRDFYTEQIKEHSSRQMECLVLSASPLSDLRSQDIFVDANLAFKELLASILSLLDS